MTSTSLSYTFEWEAGRGGDDNQLREFLSVGVDGVAKDLVSSGRVVSNEFTDIALK